MRNPKRIKRILKLLEKLWTREPDSRFGQMLINNNIVADEIQTWATEDDEFEAFLTALLGYLDDK